MQNICNKRTSARSAFTVVEILVVIAILAILGGILVPVIQGAQNASKRTACASNLRQLGVALIGYANDHDGNFPATSHSAPPGQTWIDTLAEWLGDVDEVRICPADPKGPERLKAGGTSYVLNSMVFVPKTDPFGQPIGQSYNNLRRLNRPASTLLACVVSDRVGVGSSNDHTHSENWVKNGSGSWNALISDIQPDRHRNGSANPTQTTGSSNYLYADGHVENIPAVEIRQSILAGVNPAAVPE